jgi:hypothetical protein
VGAIKNLTPNKHIKKKPIPTGETISKEIFDSDTPIEKRLEAIEAAIVIVRSGGASKEMLREIDAGMSPQSRPMEKDQRVKDALLTLQMEVDAHMVLGRRPKPKPRARAQEAFFRQPVQMHDGPKRLSHNVIARIR